MIRRTLSRIHTVLAAGLGLSLVALASPASADDEWIDTSDRNTVIASYFNEFERFEPDVNWTGNVANCNAGTTSQAYRDSYVQRTSWYRMMAGLGPVGENASATNSAQKAALIMAANNTLNHYPQPGWDCYSSAGAISAGESNLAYSTGDLGLFGIDLYMQDSGSNNLSVGHRRWMLHPQLNKIGVGEAPRVSGQNPSTNAMEVIRPSIFNDRPEVRESDGFVAWPPSGYVPDVTVWGRWSFSLDGADFSNATVSMTGPGGSVPLSILFSSSDPGVLPEPTIVWELSAFPDSASMDFSGASDQCYTVNITGVSGVSPTSYSYQTCLVDVDLAYPTNDVVQATGGPSGWQIKYDGVGNWQSLTDSSTTADKLLVGDFNGDGEDDIMNVTGGEGGWRVRWSGTGGWNTLSNSTTNIDKLLVGDFNGDREDDVLNATGGAGGWRVRWSGTGGWNTLDATTATKDTLLIGNFG